MVFETKTRSVAKAAQHKAEEAFTEIRAQFRIEWCVIVRVFAIFRRKAPNAPPKQHQTVMRVVSMKSGHDLASNGVPVCGFVSLPTKNTSCTTKTAPDGAKIDANEFRA